MPIREYDCTSCGERTEALIRSAADVPSSCPACGEKTLEQAFSAFAAPAAERANCESCLEAGQARPTGSPCAGGGCPISSL